jgi:hypothetical protein
MRWDIWIDAAVYWMDVWGASMRGWNFKFQVTSITWTMFL